MKLGIPAHLGSLAEGNSVAHLGLVHIRLSSVHVCQCGVHPPCDVYMCQIVAVECRGLWGAAQRIEGGGHAVDHAHCQPGLDARRRSTRAGGLHEGH